MQMVNKKLNIETLNQRRLQIHSEPLKRDILFLTITLANLTDFYSFYIILIVKKSYMRL